MSRERILGHPDAAAGSGDIDTACLVAALRRDGKGSLAPRPLGRRPERLRAERVDIERVRTDCPPASVSATAAGTNPVTGAVPGLQLDGRRPSMPVRAVGMS